MYLHKFVGCGWVNDSPEWLHALCEGADGEGSLGGAALFLGFLHEEGEEGTVDR